MQITYKYKRVKSCNYSAPPPNKEDIKAQAIRRTQSLRKKSITDDVIKEYIENQDSILPDDDFRIGS